MPSVSGTRRARPPRLTRSRRRIMLHDRRQYPSLRLRFEALKADLLRRLEHTWPPTMRHSEREALASEMTRRQLRHTYRPLLRRP